MAIMEEDNEYMDNYALNEVQPGGNVEICQAFKLKSDTEITIEASDLISFSNKKDTQKIYCRIKNAKAVKQKFVSPAQYMG